MVADAEFSLITVEEYYGLPSSEDVIVELHWGRLVELPWPKAWHIDLQRHIAKLLEEYSARTWEVFTGLPFRAVPQFDLRGVDVGVIAKSRWDSVGRGDLHGSPEIVIDIMPLNGEITERAALFLSTGTQQFCVVDRTQQLVRVTGLDSKTKAYGPGQEVPFPLLNASLAVDEILG